MSTVARFSPCPTLEPSGVRSARRGADRTLVPAGTDQALLCRYDGPFGGPHARIAHRFRLVGRQLILDPGHAAELAAGLDRLPRSPSGFAKECAKPAAAAIVAYFRYPSGPGDPVRVNLSGCMTATNGHVAREAGFTTALDELEALIHAEPARSAGSQGRTATIAGHLWLCGGPAPGHCFSATIGGCAPPDGCSRSNRVVAINTAGEIVAEQRLRYPYPDGRFKLHLRPGQYAVELLADGPRIHDRLMQAKGATARARHTTTVVFTFSIP